MTLTCALRITRNLHRPAVYQCPVGLTRWHYHARVALSAEAITEYGRCLHRHQTLEAAEQCAQRINRPLAASWFGEQ